jgi:chemotaxis response regulator CheB
MPICGTQTKKKDSSTLPKLLYLLSSTKDGKKYSTRLHFLFFAKRTKTEGDTLTLKKLKMINTDFIKAKKRKVGIELENSLPKELILLEQRCNQIETIHKNTALLMNEIRNQELSEETLLENFTKVELARLVIGISQKGYR